MSNSDPISQWFSKNSFRCQEFEDLDCLVTYKKAQNAMISLGLPTLNEEATVGRIIRTIQDTLVHRYPLLDEIVLIDSASTDHTVEIAQDLGVSVYQHSEILPQYGTYQGKGETLWKSLYILKGDLIVWIDTDIENIQPHFVYGLLGPLLKYDGIQYVKGYYQRPLRIGDSSEAEGGGRVTELVARPLINLFFPELSNIIQPLSGEIASDRAALECLSFYTGYGVDIGLLLDFAKHNSIGSIAQVDLQKKVHRNHSLRDLSQMAFAIIQVFFDHLERRNKVKLLNQINRTMKIIRYEMDTYMLEERPISDQLRPPIITIPEYRARHNVTNWPEQGLDWLDEQNYEELSR